MKKLLLSLFLLLGTLTYSQVGEYGGTLVEGLVPIERTNETSLSDSDLTISNDAFLTPAPSPTGNSQEVGITAGELNVSLSGAATYNIPIATPVGVRGVVPKINLSYSSQAGNGIAGYGWEISGVSVITRIPSTKHHDGTRDAVDFDGLDRFALDGQRLIVKNGTSGVYGANSTIYETEDFSNVRVTSYDVSLYGAAYGPLYFIVEYPDGSTAKYGGSAAFNSPMDWAIEYWQDPQGNRITYAYDSSSNNLLIKSISYGVNKMEFVYLTRTRPEDAYAGGTKFTNDKILSQINIKVNNIGFRNYLLEYSTTTLGYQRLIKITEKNGDNTKSLNPTVFSYDTTTDDITFSSIPTDVSISGITQINTASVSGDFDGDGHLDFLLYPLNGSLAKQNFSIFTKLNGASSAPNMGYTVPTGAFEEIFPSTWISSSNTVVPYQGITVAQKVSNSITTNFKNYYYDSTGVYPDNQKQVTFPDNTQKRYVSGDFNGDGLTDVMALEWSDINNTTAKRVFFIDLDRRKATNFMNNAGTLGNEVYGTQLNTGDVNGDGKTDLLQFFNGSVKVYSLNDSNQFVLLFTYSDTNISVATTQNILMGDYNGDGKTDFIMTKAYNTNNYAKFTSTGTTFVKLDAVYDIYYYPDSQSSCIESNRIIPTDINGDGKTDLVSFRSCVTNSNQIGNYTLKIYNNIGSNFTTNYTINTGNINGILNFPIPVCLSANKPNVYLEFAVISNGIIHRFEAHKNSSKETLLKSITTGNGVTESITYGALETSTDYFPLYTGDLLDVYPNTGIKYSPSFLVVSKLERQSADTYKKQLFAYYGAVSNLEGLGFLGFKSTMRTNWHTDTSQVISNVSKFDVNLRGALTDSFSVLSYYTPYNNPTPGTFISRAVSSYNTYDNVVFDPSLLANKVFKIKNTILKQYNGLDNTSSETTTIYDVYNHPTQVTAVIKKGTTVEQTTINNFEYDDQNIVGSVYYIGRPHKKTTSINIPQNNDTTTSEEIFDYNISQLLEKVQKKGHQTGYITETNVYGTFGNLTQKTISAPGIASRATKFEYDTTGRFVTKSIDVELLETKYENDANTGFLTKVTDPYNHVIQYKYDVWGKKTEEKIDSNTITIAYTKPELPTTLVTKTGTDGTSTIVKYDDQGREIISGVKNVDATWSYIKTAYDDFDRKISVGEPVSALTATPTQFTTMTFDNYGRPSTTIEPTGKTTTVTYSPLTTTVSDGTKTVVTIKNSLGNPVSVTDAGGTITYEYFASGNLKTTVYDNLTTSFTYNGWGKKLSLNDPSAGVYGYLYNAFGEITDESSPSPKGNTHYDYDDFGKLSKKTLTSTDGLTNSETTYTYDTATKLIKQSSFKNFLENSSIILNTYTYDATYTDRITKTVETTPYATFTKDATYDTYGRMLTETSTAKVNSNAKTSSKKVKYTYKNGVPWQILDDATSAILWQANTVNARGQLTGATFGGMTITNTYDSYGFPTQIKHDNGSTNIMTLNTVFNAQTGNLTSRNNNLISRDETFVYDSQDRLIKNTYPELINNSTFTTTTEGFTTVNGATAAVSFTRLSVKATAAQSGVQKLITTNVPQGTLLKITATVTKKGIDKIRAVIVEENITSGTTTQIVLGTITADMTFQALHEVSNSNLKVYLRFDKSELSSDVGTAKDFLLDDVIVYKNTDEIQSYDNAGRIAANKLGTYEYDPAKKYQNSAIALTAEANTYYSAKPSQTVTYNLFKCPVQITEDNVDKISFTYNDSNSRSSMFYGGLQAIKTDRPIRKDYSADGTMEIKHTSGSDELLIYIGGDGYTAPVVLKSDGAVQEYLYLHRDYQGSILAISKAGAVIEKRLFDPWGAIIAVQNGAGVVQPGLTVLERGYTGHEHLQSVGLINMNARLYDPKLHRFLQPDNFVQDPYNTQNYNRYAYVTNNPLKYTDPSGELGIDILTGGGGLGVEFGLYAWNPYAAGVGLLIMGGSALVANWDNWGIKDWANENINIKNWGNWATDNLKSINGWIDNNLRSIGKWFNGETKYFDYQVGSISFSPNFSYSSTFASTISSGNNGSYGNVEAHPYSADIHMPTQHTFLGVNMTALSEGNIIQQTVYGFANTINIPIQYLMGRGVGDGSMRNLDGTATSTSEGALAFGTLPFMLVSGGESSSIYESIGGLKQGIIDFANSFTKATGGLKQWIRTGPSYSIEGGFETFSTRWGAGGNHWKKIGNKYLQNINKLLRQTKLPGDNWRVNDPGHFHWWKK